MPSSPDSGDDDDNAPAKPHHYAEVAKLSGRDVAAARAERELELRAIAIKVTEMRVLIGNLNYVADRLQEQLAALIASDR